MLQFVVILLASYIAFKTKTKSTVFIAFMIPVVIGAALLYASVRRFRLARPVLICVCRLPHTNANKGPLLLGYYLLSFLFAANPSELVQ